MKIGILGSGMVAQQLGFGFLKSGYDVMLGTRNPAKLNDWKTKAGDKAFVGSFQDAAGFGEIIFVATYWADDATQNAINMGGMENFKGKIVVDVTNPLQFDKEGEAPKPAIGYPWSGGALIQSWLADSKVVKAFNTITANYMANPKLKEGVPDMFFAGNDPEAKKVVMDIAISWGWNVVDCGDIEQSYLLEALALLWIRYGFMNKHWKHAFKLLRE